MLWYQNLRNLASSTFPGESCTHNEGADEFLVVAYPLGGMTEDWGSVEGIASVNFVCFALLYF